MASHPHSAYDTPPNGDFASYVEALGRDSAARLLQAGTAQAQPGHRAAPHAAAPVPAAPHQTQQAVPRHALASLRRLLLSGVALWVAYAVGVTLFPELRWIGWPLLLFIVVSAVRRLKTMPWPALTQAAAREAERRLRPPSPPR